MAQEWTVETCVQKYNECKQSKNGVSPLYVEFLKHADIPKRQLARLFGSSAYSKLQNMAGDDPNKLPFERTPLATIMQQYGSLVTELGEVPAYSEWEYRALKPSENGLRKKPHNLKWSEMPETFVEWIAANNVSGFGNAIDIITASGRPRPLKSENGDAIFLRLIKDVRAWTPARRRNSEGEYKIELRKHLESLKYELNEEFGESKCDLLVRREYSIEVKKDPDLAEYDRLFGQIARHLQHHCKVIAVILEATRKDKYDNFSGLVDKYLNAGGSVELIKKN
jgi:hypothetical protein